MREGAWYLGIAGLAASLVIGSVRMILGARRGREAIAREFAGFLILLVVSASGAFGAMVSIWTIEIQNRLLEARAGLLGLTIEGPLLAAWLYHLRCRRRLLYGILEVLFGLASYVSIFIKQAIESPDSSFIAGFGPTIWLRMAAGLYIIVRGLDNIGQAAKPEAYPGWWQRAFPRRG